MLYAPYVKMPVPVCSGRYRAAGNVAVLEQFLIISEIFNYNLILGIMVMLSLFMVALSLLEELYRMKDKSNAASACILGADLPNLHLPFISAAC